MLLAASMPAGPVRNRTGSAPDRYPPPMRRWVCVVALLAGFARDADVRGVRLREPVAIQRLIATTVRPGRGLQPTGAWWARFSG